MHDRGQKKKKKKKKKVRFCRMIRHTNYTFANIKSNQDQKEIQEKESYRLIFFLKKNANVSRVNDSKKKKNKSTYRPEKTVRLRIMSLGIKIECNCYPLAG